MLRAMATGVHAWLQAGLRAQRAGDLKEARTAYLQILQQAPGHPDACQLLGLLARREGDDLAAEQWLRRSLAARDEQPHVWNNLGNLLLASSRVDEALHAYGRALQLQPNYSDALYNRARALRAAGRLVEAAASLDAAMAQAAGPAVAMLQLRAEIEADAGHLAAGLTTLEQALKLAPDRSALWHNRAVLLQRCHRHAESLAAHERAAALGLDAADAHYNLGNTLQSLGRMVQAEAAYRAALLRQPQHLLALLDLARLRWRQAAPDFDAELRLAVAANPDSPDIARLLGSLLWRAQRYGEALQVYQQAVSRAPGDAVLQDGLGRCLVRLGQTHSGLAAHQLAVRLAPDDAELHTHHATSLLGSGRTDDALRAADTACRLAPLHQHAQALRMLAWRLLGDASAAALGDPGQLVRVLDLPAPAGWPDMVRFNEALAGALRHLHGADRQAPVDQTLRGGTQTMGDLFAQGHVLVDQLKTCIAEAVTATIAQWPLAEAADPAHPFLARRPADPAAWRFTSAWSSRLTQHGFHTDHVHPQGWMSSAYYVQVPEAVQDTRRQQGWLRFGVPDFPLPAVDRESLVQRVEQPAPGRLVLFPSMMWHGTTPFDEDAERITIAFDLLPD